MSASHEENVMSIYPILSALLTYPEQPLLDALPEIERALDAQPGARAALAPLVESLRATPLIELQERYVATFDRTPSHSLHLFEHVHGESRDRGPAMVDLLRMYERHGLYLSAHALPDYLPVFLEYLSRLPERDARNLLTETAQILQALAAALAKRGSHYAFAIGALLSLAGKGPPDVPAAPDDDAHPTVDHRALDADYADEPVRFVGAATPGAEPVRFYDKRPAR